MLDIQWYDLMRLCSATLFTVAAFYTAKSARSHWQDYTPRGKDYLWAYMTLTFLMGVGGLEAIRRDIHWDWRTLMAFFIAVVCFRAGYHHRDVKPQMFNNMKEN